jgi:hypothetical protein
VKAGFTTCELALMPQRYVAGELDKAAERLTRAQGKSEISDSQVNLPVSDVGQSVLNLTAEQTNEPPSDIVERLKGHIAAGYQPTPRGDAPRDDTLAEALAEIERLRQLVEKRA